MLLHVVLVCPDFGSPNLRREPKMVGVMESGVPYNEFTRTRTGDARRWTGDGGCLFPICDAPKGFPEMVHIKFWLVTFLI